jgi:hypothetical protein
MFVAIAVMDAAAGVCRYTVLRDSFLNRKIALYVLSLI